MLRVKSGDYANHSLSDCEGYLQVLILSILSLSEILSAPPSSPLLRTRFASFAATQTKNVMWPGTPLLKSGNFGGAL